MTRPALDVLRVFVLDNGSGGKARKDARDALADLDALVQAGWDVVASQGGPDSLRVFADHLSRVTGEAR